MPEWKTNKKSSPGPEILSYNLDRMKQEDHKFKASLGCMENSGLKHKNGGGRESLKSAI